ncbi:MAG: cob(I)yrinic acid a,c-diamide adenosyltransferase [Firmicutes bacterium]|nr:cob(I)yrinic acid a,c-diamide adenosyltransferase [Bacillota bacterium]
MKPVVEDLPELIRVHDSFKRGLIQVYTGDGKGKTTAALGLALRACGHRFTVTIIQFVKGVSYTGELFSLQRLYPEIQIFQFGRDCKRASSIRQGSLGCMNCGECMLRIGEITEEDYILATKGFNLAFKIATGGKADILILDEISLAIDFGLLLTDDVIKLIEGKANNIEIVFTGRNMPREILGYADLITEMHEVRHPYTQGIPARRGIEY